jgi:hypothetical protein
MRTGSSKRAAFCIAFALAGAARADDAAQPPPAVAFELAGTAIIVRDAAGETLVPIGCEPRSFASTAEAAYALCGESTVIVVAAKPDPHVVERRFVDARIVSLTVVGGVVSARTLEGVKPLDDYPRGYPGASATPHRRRHDVVLYAPGEGMSGVPHDALAPPPARVHGFEARLAGTTGPGFDGPVGVFATFDASLVYRFDVPFSVSAYGTFGAATGEFQQGDRNFGPRGGDVQVAVGEALVGVDTRVVGFSFGAGSGMFERGYDVEPLIVARGRFGPIDELAFTWHTSFATGGTTLLGVLGGAIDFRVIPSLWLGADAELGNLRYGRFMLDARYRLRGEGASGTLDLVGGLGLAYVESSALCDSNLAPSGSSGDTECLGTNVDYLGPALSLGVMWRP